MAASGYLTQARRRFVIQAWAAAALIALAVLLLAPTGAVEWLERRHLRRAGAPVG